MAIAKKNVALIVVLMIIALLGLVVVQTTLLRSAYASKEEAFRRSVQTALASTAQKLAHSEVYSLAFDLDSTTIPSGVTTMMAFIQDSTEVNIGDTIVSSFSGNLPNRKRLVWIDGNVLHYSVESPQHVTVEAVEPNSGEHVTVVDSFRQPGDYSVTLDDSLLTASHFVWHGSNDDPSSFFDYTLEIDNRENATTIKEIDRQILIKAAIKRWEGAEQQSIEERVNAHDVDSLLSSSLDEAGVGLDYVFGIHTADDSMHLVSRPEYSDELAGSAFQTRLFPFDLTAPSSNLRVFFPGHTFYLWKEMAPLTAATTVFMLIIVLSFIYTIRTILTQQQFAGRLIDFINNMTHEFKTPISTIQLAAEAIDRDDVIVDRDKVTKFNQMILTENRRMKKQADKILQMAVLEEGDYELKFEEINVHDLIANAVAAVQLHIDSRHGSIEAKLEAKRFHLTADRVHLANIIHNLLDNANKYTPNDPRIVVSTKNQDSGLVIEFADNGIGIPSENLVNVFEKYYRISTGNIHNVKGFGLGLSYVRLMTEAMRGKVTIESQPGRGTTVRLSFPAATLVN